MQIFGPTTERGFWTTQVKVWYVLTKQTNNNWCPHNFQVYKLVRVSADDDD